MTRTETTAADLKLLENFENCSHPNLTHEEHVQLGYLYLRDAPLIEVLIDFPPKLRRYAENKGADNLYHETITWAFLALIHERLQTGPSHSWHAFSAANPDLFERGLLERYYTTERLDSALARRVFLLPLP